MIFRKIRPNIFPKLNIEPKYPPNTFEPSLAPRETDDETGELILCSTSQNISFLNTQILRAAEKRAGSTHHLLKTTGCPTSNCALFLLACGFFATPSVISQTFEYCSLLKQTTFLINLTLNQSKINS